MTDPTVRRELPPPLWEQILHEFREDTLTAYDCASLLSRRSSQGTAHSGELTQNILQASIASLRRMDDVSTLMALSRKTFTLQQIAFHLPRLLDGLARPGELQIHIPEAIAPQRRGDPESLRRLLRHLVENARVHAPPGLIQLVVEIGSSPGKLQFRVVDVGPGPKPEVCELRPEFLGLGLTLARELCPLLGGRLYFEAGATLANGSAAILELPLETVELAHAGNRAGPELPGTRVLLVPRTGPAMARRCTFTELLRSTLQERGVVLLGAGETRPDALVVELDRSCEQARERILSLRSEYGQEVPVLVIASHPQRGDAEFFSQLGCQAFLGRPFQAEQLVAALERARLQLPESELITSHAIRESKIQALRIGILDLNATARFLTGRLLQRAGHEAIEFADVDQLLKAAEEGALDLVLTDLALEMAAGLDTARRVRALPGAGCQLAMLAVTTHQDSESRAMILEAGFCDILVKPFRYEELVRLVNLWGGCKVGVPEPAAESAQKPAIDRAMLTEGSLNDPEFERELIATFLIEGRQQLNALKRSCTSSNAHAFKGNAAVMGATQLAALLQKLEQTPDPTKLDAVEAEYDRVEVWLHNHTSNA